MTEVKVVDRERRQCPVCSAIVLCDVLADSTVRPDRHMSQSPKHHGYCSASGHRWVM